MEPNFPILSQLSTSESAVLDYINSHPKELANMNIQELANTTFVSTATILRLCKKLNLRGFNELKYGYKHIYKDNVMQMDIPAEFRDIISNRLSQLRQMNLSILVEDIRVIVDALCGNYKVFLFARGLSYMPMNYMYNVLLTTDRDCILYIDPPLIYNAAQTMGSNCLVIIASSGGVTREVIKAAELTKEHGAKVVVLSSYEESQLKTIADIFLHCPSEVRYYKGVDIKSRFSIMYMIEMILNSYLNRMYYVPPIDPSTYINQKNW